MVDKAFRKVKSNGGPEEVDGKGMSYMAEHKQDGDKDNNFDFFGFTFKPESIYGKDESG